MAVLAIEGNATTGVEQGGVPGETTTDVSDLSLDFEIETPAAYFADPKLIRLVVIEAQTEGLTITGTLVLNTGNVALGTFSTTAGAKERVEIPIAAVGEVASVRLAATALTKRIEIAAIELDVEDD